MDQAKITLMCNVTFTFCLIWETRTQEHHQRMYYVFMLVSQLSSAFLLVPCQYQNIYGLKYSFKIKGSRNHEKVHEHFSKLAIDTGSTEKKTRHNRCPTLVNEKGPFFFQKQNV